MALGRRRTRTGDETRSTFDKSPEVDMAILEIQRRYLQTGRAKPSMRDLLMEGIAALLQREGLPAMQEGKRLPAVGVIQMPHKTGA
jgi:hypothetical protein